MLCDIVESDLLSNMSRALRVINLRPLLPAPSHSNVSFLRASSSVLATPAALNTENEASYSRDHNRDCGRDCVRGHDRDHDSSSSTAALNIKNKASHSINCKRDHKRDCKRRERDHERDHDRGDKGEVVEVDSSSDTKNSLQHCVFSLNLSSDLFTHASAPVSTPAVDTKVVFIKYISAQTVNHNITLRI